jgi:peptide/nickel transport system permease protein
VDRRGVSRYIVQRLLQGVVVLLAVSVVMFGLIHLAPGGPMAMYASGANADPQQMVRIETQLGLRDPIPIQYIRWFTSMLSGNWGVSYRDGLPVTQVVGERLPATIFLMGTSLLVAVVLAVPFGVLGAVSRRGVVRALLSVMAIAGMSIPTFWLGLMILVVFALQLRWIPTGGMAASTGDTGPLDLVYHVIAPALVLATLNIAGWSRYLRSSMLEVLGQDYVRTARSKGLTQRSVMYGHALKNGLLPLITLLGLEAPRLVGGALVTEVVFAWPGIGQLMTTSLLARDYPVLMATFLLMALLVISGNLVADLAYGWADPRIRLT